MKKSIEPFWWAFFGVGGALSALFIPVLLAINGLAVPLGWIAVPEHTQVLDLLELPVTRIFVFALISLSLLHWAHRFRFTLYDGLQVKHLNELIAIMCYGTALLITCLTGYTLWQI